MLHLIRSQADIEAIEHEMPWEQRLAENSAYELIGAVAQQLPDKPAIQFLPDGLPDDVPVTITYGELLRRMRQTANLLHDLGIAPDDAVSVLLPNLPHMHYLLWGGAAAGIVNPINPLLRPPQIAEIIQAASSRLLVTTGPGTDLWDKAQAALGLLGYPVKLVRVAGEETSEAIDFDRVIERYPGDRLLSGRIPRREEIAAYFHTGGTTGDPKLARHTHGAQVFQAWVGAALGVEEDDVIPIGLPLFHVAAAYCWGIAPLSVGATLVLLSPTGYRNPAVIPNLWKLIERVRATRVGVVPTVASALLGVPKQGADTSSVKRFGCGAAPLSVETARAFETYAGAPLLEGYGLTEASGLTHCNPDQGERRIGSIGLRCPYVETRVLELDAAGDNGAECPPGVVGVIAVKGPTVMPGYRQQRHNRGAFIGDGWLNTGDLGYVDADGYFWLTGRAKDVIIRGGHNISPACIEEALYEHPAVALAAAVGKADAYSGEVPMAYVVLKPGATAQPEELRVFASERVPERPAAPVEVVLIDQMPVTAVGKIFKPALRYDATRRAIESALAPLSARGFDVVIEVGPDERFGACARVKVKATSADTIQSTRAEVETILEPFTFHREVLVE